MHFWKTKLVALELKENTLGQDSLKSYYLATSVLVLVTYYLAMLSSHKNLGALAFEAVASLVITVLGINTAFHANGGISGTRFLDKVVSISFPLLIKVLAAGFAVGLIVGALESSGIGATEEAWFVSLSIVAIQGVFYWRLITHIKEVNA